MNTQKEPIVSCVFSGRLGNVLLEIINTFIFAKELGIKSDRVKFHKWYVGSNGIAYNEEIRNKPRHKNYLMENKDIFIPLMPHFVYGNEWKEAKKSIVNSPYGCSRENIIQKAWPGLIKGLFYDKEIFEAYREKFPAYYENEKNKVALHVRRGDYQVYANGKWFLSKEQVQAKVNKCDNKTVVIFSDDISWCKSNLHAPKNGHIIFHEGDEIPACSDIILMSNFKNIIPADNSSYSAFAKFLSNDIRA